MISVSVFPAFGEHGNEGMACVMPSALDACGLACGIQRILKLVYRLGGVYFVDGRLATFATILALQSSIRTAPGRRRNASAWHRGSSSATSSGNRAHHRRAESHCRRTHESAKSRAEDLSGINMSFGAMRSSSVQNADNRCCTKSNFTLADHLPATGEMDVSRPPLM